MLIRSLILSLLLFFLIRFVRRMMFQLDHPSPSSQTGGRKVEEADYEILDDD